MLIKKIIIVGLLSLIVAILGELTYLTLAVNRPRSSTIPTGQPEQNPPLSQQESQNPVTKFINQLKTSRNYVDCLTILKKIQKGKRCDFGKDCVDFDNRNYSLWHTDMEENEPVAISSPFAFRLTLTSENGMAGVFLNGTPLNHSQSWWKNIRSLFVGVDTHSGIIYIDVKNGSSPNPIVILNKKLNSLQTQFVLFSDLKGENFWLTDASFSLIYRFNLNQVTNQTFPGGMFPDQKIYIGYGTAGKTYLLINQLQYVPLIQPKESN